MRSRPPDISFTRLTYSCAISLKMSAEPHEPCILMTIGDCDLTIIGKPSAAAPVPAAAAPVRNLRRDAVGLSCWVLIDSSSCERMTEGQLATDSITQPEGPAFRAAGRSPLLLPRLLRALRPHGRLAAEVVLVGHLGADLRIEEPAHRALGEAPLRLLDLAKQRVVAELAHGSIMGLELALQHRIRGAVGAHLVLGVEIAV